jgi:mannose-6-phosphate isomerase-like protein (cupin superfamily)
MKQTVKIAEGDNFTAVNIGCLDSLTDHSFINPKSGQEVKGKVFLKDVSKATGTEISLSTLPPHSELPYFHTHNKNEEMYIILKGAGNFQVDDDCFPIAEGSVVRVAPKGKRGICNASDIPMIYMCVQAKENSLEEYTSNDGEKVACLPKWEKP